MKVFLTAAILICSSQTYASSDELGKAKTAACFEAAKVQFEFDGICEDELTLVKENKYSFIFSAHDSSGDCDITINVNKTTGKANSKVECN